MRALRGLVALGLAASLAPARAAVLPPGGVPCATAVSRWGPPTAVSRAALRASRDRALALGGFHVVIDAEPGLAANAAALAAWQRAAAEWEAVIADPVTVTITADLAAIAEPGVLGQTSGVLVQADYDEVRDAMAAAALSEPDDAIVAALPTSAELAVTGPLGGSWLGFVVATKANLKALGFTGLDARLGASDATITFNSSFPFDFDRSDGTAPGTIDFESVAAHELGHALGFVSAVDFADQGLLLPPIMPLDLFRFRDGSADDPASPAEFTTAHRSLLPGSNDVFDDLASEHRLSTGVDGGDGRQASHWKDDALTGIYVGLMDPTLSPRVTLDLTAADARAMDLIGWDVAGGGTFTTTTTTTSTSLPPECVEDAACADADPCTRDFCGFPRCVHQPIARPIDASVDVPAVEALDGCAGTAVPRRLVKRARAVRALLVRADRTRRARTATLLRRAGKRLTALAAKAASQQRKGRLAPECEAAIEAAVERAESALACVTAASGG